MSSVSVVIGLTSDCVSDGDDMDGDGPASDATSLEPDNIH
jgi:hypothetical protein